MDLEVAFYRCVSCMVKLDLQEKGGEFPPQIRQTKERYPYN